MDRTGLRDGDIVAVHRTPEAQSGQVVVARFGDEVTLKRFVRIDERHVELRPESDKPVHRVMELDLAKHILQIEGIAVGALIGELRDAPTKAVGARARDRAVRRGRSRSDKGGSGHRGARRRAWRRRSRGRSSTGSNKRGGGRGAVGQSFPVAWRRPCVRAAGPGVSL